MCSCLTVAAASAQPPAGLSEAEVTGAAGYLAAALAGPGEDAFLQILTSAEVVRDDLQDTVAAYDLVVRFDPRRYRNPMVGRYPLTFEGQFISWGKRLGLLTRSTTWRSGRYYLHDVSTGRQAWAHARELRELYPPTDLKYPPAASPERPASLTPWLDLMHHAEGGTDLRAMGRWLRVIREESREQVQARRRAAAATAADSIGGAP
ncbi:MAG: hypothetical protein ABIL09_00460 [Gemmatimonadota bacterium]